MLELFLIYLWENKLLQLPLHTEKGESIEVLSPGRKNTDSGPDFLEARLKINNILWIGSVEMHINASDWYAHGHQDDRAYDNVILHVVYQADKSVFDVNKRELTTLVVENKFQASLLLRYRQFLDSSAFIPCFKRMGEVQRFTWFSWLDRMAAERLQEKVSQLFVELEAAENDWETVFYKKLLSGFGMKVNDFAFAQLAQQLPFSLLLRHQDRLDQLEALLFGVAGFLEDNFTDEYPLQLKKEYAFLKHKYSLNSLTVTQWRFMRMRPPNFPTIRISQFAALIHKNGRMFSKIISAETTEDIFELFRVQASDYWDNHYRFDTFTKGKPKQLGTTAINILLINTVVQMLFAYGIIIEQAKYGDKALALLEKLPPEDNVVTRGYAKGGLEVINALHSQALLHLKRNYCDKKRCLDCNIGHVLIKSNPTEI